MSPGQNARHQSDIFPSGRVSQNQDNARERLLSTQEDAREACATTDALYRDDDTSKAEAKPPRDSEDTDRSSADEMGDLLKTPSFQRRRSSPLVMNAGGRPSSTRSKLGGGDSILEEADGPPSSEHSMEMNQMASDDESMDDEETGLTHAQRKKRRQWKKKNMGLDQRIAGRSGLDHDGGDDKKDRSEEKLVYATMVRDMLINAILIGSWYCFSISISVYNKWMFSKDNLNFHFPLFSTSMHMLVQFALASLVLTLVPSLRPAPPELARGDYEQLSGDTSVTSSKAKPIMTRWFYISRIGPCGTATALDIGLGNFSLRYITLTFYTMCKSSVLAFVLVFAFIFRLEKPTWKLCAVILFMTAGVIMMVAGEAAFDARGFILVMTASFCSGFRWSLTQILLLRNPATSNPFSSIFFLTPVMFVALFALALPTEGPAEILAGIHLLNNTQGHFLGVLILLFPGCLAFLMVAAEFALLKRTSVVTLSVCGIFKEVLTISAASVVFGDELSPINVSGLFVTIASIGAYNVLKYQKMKEEAKKGIQQSLQEDDAIESFRPIERVSESGEAGRDSMSVRSGLLNLGTNIDGGRLPGYGQVKSAVSNGPVKRPEDLE